MLVRDPPAQGQIPGANTLKGTTNQVTEADVCRVFKSIKAGKVARPDAMTSRVPKPCFSQRSSVFTDIFNVSLSLGVVPTHALRNPFLCLWPGNLMHLV